MKDPQSGRPLLAWQFTAPRGGRGGGLWYSEHLIHYFPSLFPDIRSLTNEGVDGSLNIRSGRVRREIPRFKILAYLVPKTTLWLCNWRDNGKNESLSTWISVWDPDRG
jgi:hypothetical protein